MYLMAFWCCFCLLSFDPPRCEYRDPCGYMRIRDSGTKLRYYPDEGTYLLFVVGIHPSKDEREQQIQFVTIS